MTIFGVKSLIPSADYSDCDLLLFCHVAKTAGGSLWHSLRDHLEPAQDHLHMSKYNPRRLYSQSHYNFRQYDDFNFRSVAKFTLLRDPIDRFLSEHYFISQQDNFAMYCPIDLIDRQLPEFIASARNLSLLPVQFSLRSFLFDWQIEKFGQQSFDLSMQHYRHLTREWRHLNSQDLVPMVEQSIRNLVRFEYVGPHTSVSQLLDLICDFLEVPNKPQLTREPIHVTPKKQGADFLKDCGIYEQTINLLTHDYKIYNEFIGQS